MLRKIVKTAAIIFSGNISAQILLLAVSPILTRLYSPEEFGVFGVFSSSLYIILSFSSLRYDISIPLVGSDVDAKLIAFASVFITACTSVIVFFACSVIYFNYPSSSWHTAKWMMPLAILAAGFYDIAVQVNLRYKNYYLISRTKVVQSVLGATTQVFLGVMGIGALGLIAGQIVGLSAGTTNLNLPSTLRAAAVGITGRLRMFRIFANLKAQSKYAAYDAPAALIAIGNNHAATLLIGIVYGPVAAGIYAIAQRVVVLPFGVISSAITNTLNSYGKDINNNTRSQLYSTSAAVFCIASPLITGLAFFFIKYFGIFFGSEWSAAGEISAWCILFVGQKLLFDSFFLLYAIEGFQKTGLKVQMIIFLTRHLPLPIISLVASYQHTIIFFSIISAVIYFIANNLHCLICKKQKFRILLIQLVDVIAPFILVFCAIELNINNLTMYMVVILYVIWACFRGLLGFSHLRSKALK